MTEKLVKTLIISNALTLLASLGALYFSYQASEEASSAYWSAAEASDEASAARESMSDIESTVSRMDTHGVNCN